MTLCFLFVDDVFRVFLEERFCHGVGIFVEVVFRVLRSFSSFSCHILCSSRDRQSLLIIRSSTCVHRNLSLFDFTKASFVAINLAKVFAYIRLSEAHKAYHCRAPSDIACTSSPRNKTQNVTGRVVFSLTMRCTVSVNFLMRTDFIAKRLLRKRNEKKNCQPQLANN